MGSGFRVWTAGEVVSASNVNNYLQEQTVMSFAGTAARSSAIASPEEGMLSYLQDTDTYQGYDGTNWVNLNTLSGTDTSGLVHIDTVSASAVASFSVDDVFTSTYKKYRVIIENLFTSSTSNFQIRLRAAGSDLTSNNYQHMAVGLTTANAADNIATVGGTTCVFGRGFTNNIASAHFDFFNPQINAETRFSFGSVGITAGGVNTSINGHCRINANTQFDGFTIYAAAGNVTLDASIYGYKE